MESKLALSFFLFGKYQSLIEDLKHVVGDEEDPVLFNSYLEVKDLVDSFEKIDNTIAIFCVESKEDCAKILEALKLSKANIQQKRVRFAGFNLSADPTMEETLKKGGCRDILNAKEAHAKKLKFKIALWRKMLKTPLVGSSGSATSPANSAAPEVNKSLGEEVIGHRKELVAALPITKDIWNYRTDKDCEFEENVWSLKLEGPNPKSVFWDKSSKVIGGWEMFYTPTIPADSKDKTGSWICLGDRPLYLEADGLWLFKGNYITLSFKTKSEEFIKVETKDRVIRIAKTKNSAEKPAASLPPTSAIGKPAAPASPATSTTLRKKVDEQKAPAASAKVLPFVSTSVADAEIKQLTQDAKIEIKLIPMLSGKEDLAKSKNCQFEDFYEHELTLLLAKDQLPKANQYKATFLFEYGEKKLAFVLDCTLDEKTEYDEEREMLIFYVEKVDQKMMDQFMEIYSQRQSTISSFLKAVSGIE